MAISTLAAAVAAVALEEYRQEKGRHPESLAELAERTAISPDLLRTRLNDGYVYRYEVTSDGYPCAPTRKSPGGQAVASLM